MTGLQIVLLALILLAYLLGTTLFDERVGLIAGLLMSVEPLAWLCSQKIWMETTGHLSGCIIPASQGKVNHTKHKRF